MQTFAKTQRQETSNERAGSVKPAAAKEQSRLFGIMGLQQSIGNAAVGRLLRQVAAEAAAKKASDTQRQKDSETPGPEVNSSGPIDSPVDSATQTEPAIQAGTKPVLGESPSPSDNASVDNQAGIPGAAAQAPVLTQVGTQASDNKFVSFTQSSASSIARTISTFGGEVRQEFESVRTSSAEQAPVIKVTLPGDPESATAEKSQPKKPAALPSADGITAPTVSTGDGLTAEETAVPSQPDGEGVSTSAGAAPKMRLEGDADPTHLSTATSQSQAIGTEIRNQIASDIVDVANAATIQRTGVEREEEISITTTKASPAIQASQEMLEFINTDVPANVRAIADADFAPLLEQSLAGPRQQVEQATQQRDADRDQAFADAMAETEAASQQAHDDQQKAVKDGYDQIAAEKQKGLEEGQQTLTEFDTEVKQRHVANDELIRTKVQTEQEKADEAIRNGEAEARAAEEQAHKDKKKAEEEAERNKPEEPDRKWYEKVADWFVDAINRWKDALVAAVTAVFDYARKVISDALTAAKNLAVGIIRSVKSFVVSTIQTFAAGLKVLVNGLLVAFPALRDKVNAAIDGVVAVTVQIVETVASKLEEAVTAIVDKVQSTVNRILDICELVIVTQIQIVGALLTGNFLDAARILFLAACKAVGIPGEEFLDILADANDALLDIMKRPAAFLGNLLKAVGQGMSNFFSNFPQRMIGGLTGWLFGQVAEGGIVLPKSFDLKSIFTLLLQVMGFTYDYIKTKVVSLVGEKAVSIIEQVMTPIRILFTEGPEALWHWLADQAEQAKATIVQAVSEWIVTKIITEAAIKLATMFTPVGAFVQAVLMMYNTIMFFVEKIKEIFAWVKSITSSLKTIAVGAIATAADYIDQSMAKSIPLIIAFLAKLLGIDGISSKIRDIVSKLRTPVDKAITFVVENLIKLAKAAWGGIKKGATAVRDAVVNWWNTEQSFKTQDGVPHRLFFEGSGESATLMVASEKKPVDAAIAEQRTLQTGTDNQLSAIVDEKSKLDATIGKQGAGNSNEHKAEPVQERVKTIADRFSELNTLDARTAKDLLPCAKDGPSASRLAAAAISDFPKLSPSEFMSTYGANAQQYEAFTRAYQNAKSHQMFDAAPARPDYDIIDSNGTVMKYSEFERRALLAKLDVARAPFAAVGYVISSAFTDDENKRMAAAGLGQALGGIAEGFAGVAQSRQMNASQSYLSPTRKAQVAEVRNAERQEQKNWGILEREAAVPQRRQSDNGFRSQSKRDGDGEVVLVEGRVTSATTRNPKATIELAKKGEDATHAIGVQSGEDIPQAITSAPRDLNRGPLKTYESEVKAVQSRAAELGVEVETHVVLHVKHVIIDGKLVPLLVRIERTDSLRKMGTDQFIGEMHFVADIDPETREVSVRNNNRRR